MKAQQASGESQVTNRTADSKKQLPKIIWQFGEIVEVSEERKEEIDLTLPIINSTIQTFKKVRE